MRRVALGFGRANPTAVASTWHHDPLLALFGCSVAQRESSTEPEKTHRLVLRMATMTMITEKPSAYLDADHTLEAACRAEGKEAHTAEDVDQGLRKETHRRKRSGPVHKSHAT